MKNYLCLNTFLLFVLLSPRANAQQVVEKIATETCTCIEQSSLNESPTNLELLTSTCVQQAMLEHIGDITEAYRADLSNPETSREIGESIGKEVGAWLSTQCSAYRMLQSRPTPTRARTETLSHTLHATEGSITGQRGEEMAFIIVVDEYGDELSFLWLEKFPDSEEYLGRVEDLKGRRVRIIWREIQLYQVRTQNYRKSKEIRGLELLD
jgi:hypothetical protein